LKLTAKQEQANRLLGSDATHILLFGGSRSGKTFLIVRAIVLRALAADGSRHAILRFRYNAVKSSIIADTFPKVMKLCFPEIEYRISVQDGFATLPNDSQIWFGGLDDKERVEKVLGMEFVTIALNETSQIPKSSRDVAVTRLAQNVTVGATGQSMRRKMFYDENPPSKGHWTYRLFIEKRDPDTKEFLADQNDYAAMQVNPEDNQENLPTEYLDTLKGLNARLQRRFLKGEFADTTENALFPEEDVDKWRVMDGVLPDMQRIVVAVDPSGSGDEDNAANDEIGICVVGLGINGIGYVLEDCAVKAGPTVWGNVATTAFDRHSADMVVAEINFGGAMVQHVIKTSRAKTPFKQVTASRGKVVRAEPFSPLFSDGRVRIVGNMALLEDELSAFSTQGYMGNGSPNRADAMIWGLTELFPGIVSPRKEPPKKVFQRQAVWAG